MIELEVLSQVARLVPIHPSIAGVLECVRLEEILIGLDRQTKAWHRIN